MRLAFDLDGTMADLQGALAREAHALFPDVDRNSLPRSASHANDTAASRSDDQFPDPTLAPLARSLSVRQQREIWKAATARVNFWETLDEIEPGALSRLYRLV